MDEGFNRLGDTLELIPTYQFNASLSVSPPWAEKNHGTAVRFLKRTSAACAGFTTQPDQAAEFFTQEMGVKPPYARRGVDYFTKNKIFPIDGAVTLDG